MLTDKPKLVALVGNPNCGKTLIFNALTGRHQHVGNFPGVTVEKKIGHTRGDHSIFYIDLPGVYSLSPYSGEEIVTREYLTSENPDIVLNVIDASNLERNLYLTTQILETGKKVILVINMIDIAKERGVNIDINKIEKTFGVPVITTNATNQHETKEKLISMIHQIQCPKNCAKNCSKNHNGCSSLPRTPKPLSGIFSTTTEKMLAKISVALKGHCDAQSKRYFSIKALEKDQLIMDELNMHEEDFRKIKHIVSEFEEEQKLDSDEIIATERYSYITKIVKECATNDYKNKKHLTDKIDSIILNKWLALPIFVLIMFAIYFITINTVGAVVTDWTNDYLFGNLITGWAESLTSAIGAPVWATGLFIDGIIAGVGGVIGFVPQIMLLFFFLSMLEDSGYMARIAFILDKIFCKFGLNGKSIIPIMIGTGCGVPGIMATKTIENEADRKISIITTTFIPCSAKLPVIALISGVFSGQSFMAPLVYFIGIFSIVISGSMLKKTRIFAADVSPFILELPLYHKPKLSSLLLHMWHKGFSFIKKAGTIILLACVLIWFLSSFDFSLKMVDTNNSMLALIGKKIAVIFTPLGFGDWRATCASITGLLAKENLVGTLSVLFNSDSNDVSYLSVLKNTFSSYQGFSFLLFNLLCAPCFAAIGAIYKEMLSIRWTVFAVLYQCLFAYAFTLIYYQGYLFLTGHGMTVSTLIALLLIVWAGYSLFFKKTNPNTIEFGIHRH